MGDCILGQACEDGKVETGPGEWVDCPHCTGNGGVTLADAQAFMVVLLGDRPVGVDMEGSPVLQRLHPTVVAYIVGKLTYVPEPTLDWRGTMTANSYFFQKEQARERYMALAGFLIGVGNVVVDEIRRIEAVEEREGEKFKAAAVTPSRRYWSGLARTGEHCTADYVHHHHKREDSVETVTFCMSGPEKDETCGHCFGKERLVPCPGPPPPEPTGT